MAKFGLLLECVMYPSVIVGWLVLITSLVLHPMLIILGYEYEATGHGLHPYLAAMSVWGLLILQWALSGYLVKVERRYP
jgi:hypothetical protein